MFRLRDRLSADRRRKSGGSGVMNERRVDGSTTGTGSNEDGSIVVSHALVKILADMVEHTLARDAGRLVGEEVESAQGDEEAEP